MRQRSLVRSLAWLALAGISGFFIAMHPATFDAVRGRTFTGLSGTADLDNGKNLFWAGGCASCHATENQPDRTRLGGGHGLKSPFGTFYVPNISSHPRDGIGNWTVAQFARAMVQGVSPDGRHYYPSFPYASYQRMTDGDLRDLFGFMKTLPAVEGTIRDHDLPFPFNIRLTLGGWKWLFLDGKPFMPVAAQSAEFNRGAYLTEGPGHCAECHSPRNLLGGIMSGMRLAGGPDPEGKGGWIPNLTPHESGLKSWSKGAIAAILSSGMKDDGDFVGGSMASVSKNFANVKKEDVNAIADYLKNITPIDHKRPAK
ncbi:MAG: c-type cytochrome [Beijerinckiaceae bacterium]